MSKVGKISPIKREYSNSSFKSLDSSLAAHGYVRMPGTSEGFLPYKEPSGKYRTGLDPHAGYLLNMSEEDRLSEVKRIEEDLKFIASTTNGLDVSPTSRYYNFGSNENVKVQMVKLGNEDALFNLDDPFELITWRWLSVNPRIAPSQAVIYKEEYRMAKYFIADDSQEQRNSFEKKKKINAAKAELEKLTPTKSKQIARLMGLPVSDDSTIEFVYNEIDTSLQKGELEGSGIQKGASSVNLFLELVNMKDARLRIKDLIKQALQHNVYRLYMGDFVYEGENKVANNEKELADILLNDKNQDMLLALETKLKQKKVLAA